MAAKYIVRAEVGGRAGARRAARTGSARSRGSGRPARRPAARSSPPGAKSPSSRSYELPGRPSRERPERRATSRGRGSGRSGTSRASGRGHDDRLEQVPEATGRGEGRRGRTATTSMPRMIPCCGHSGQPTSVAGQLAHRDERGVDLAVRRSARQGMVTRRIVHGATVGNTPNHRPRGPRQQEGRPGASGRRSIGSCSSATTSSPRGRPARCSRSSSAWAS